MNAKTNISDMNIYEKMAAITAEIGVVAKELSVNDGTPSGYKAVAERSILDAVKPLEEKYGVYSYPVAPRQYEYDRFEREFPDDKNPGQTKKVPYVHILVTTTYRFVNIHKPEEYIDMTSFGVGYDRRGIDDKLVGKAMTYADKYALIKAYKIPTGDANDPDSESQLSIPDDGFFFSSPSGGGITVNPPAPNNPMNFGGVKAPIQPSKEGSSTEPSMTLEEAQKLIVPIGEFSGKSLGEVYALNQGFVKNFTNAKFIKNNPEQTALVEAAKALLYWMDM